MYQLVELRSTTSVRREGRLRTTSVGGVTKSEQALDAVDVPRTESIVARINHSQDPRVPAGFPDVMGDWSGDIMYHIYYEQVVSRVLKPFFFVGSTTSQALCCR